MSDRNNNNNNNNVAASIALDLVFIVDCTGSMGSYISAAQQNILKINQQISLTIPDTRYALVCYRDHPPQDRSYIARTFEFTSDIEKMKTNVNTMSASGGGDGPESVCCGLYDAWKLEYRKDALKICVFITDAPPHGLNEAGDGFPKGCPLGRDPITIVRRMSSDKGIILYTVACQPSVSHVQNCLAFYQGIAAITGGCCVSLTSADLLPKLIVGSANEEFSLKKIEPLVRQLENTFGSKQEYSRDQMADRITTELSKNGVKTTQMVVQGNDKEASLTWLFAANGSLAGASKEAAEFPANNPSSSSAKTNLSTTEAPVTKVQVQRVLRRLPQTIPLPNQVKNPEGGYSYKVNDEVRLRRFLCLGADGAASYTATEPDLKRENAAIIQKMIDEDNGEKVLELVVDYSVNGKAAKQNPILFALAMCCRLGTARTKAAAYAALPKVCRIPTHLFQFIEYCEAIVPGATGWGRAHRKAVSAWYLQTAPKQLAFAVTKYKQRGGWSHRDVLRLSHPHPPKPEQDEGHQLIFKYIVRGWPEAIEYYNSIPQPQRSPSLQYVFDFLSTLDTLELIQKQGDTNEKPDLQMVIAAIKKFHLAHEHIPSVLLKEAEIWRSLLMGGMPMTAMMRTLNRLTALGILTPSSEETTYVIEKISNIDELRKARMHPFSVLVSLKAYEGGKGDKGSLEWTPVPAILAALEKAFYACFAFVEPTNQRYLLAVDVSASMTIPVVGSSITAREAAAAMALVTARTEKNVVIKGFSKELVTLPITAQSDLKTTIAAMSGLPLGPTDCAAPMLWAEKNNVPVDVFVVYTDSETYVGSYHPKQALDRYRKVMGIEAKLIVVGMCMTEFTLADPTDAGMMDIAGFDSSAPELMRNFVVGLI